MSKPVWIHPTVNRVLRTEPDNQHQTNFVKYVPASELDKAEARNVELEAVQAKYDDLLMEVHNKIPCESRHESAKRIIHQHEHTDNLPTQESES